MQQKEGCQDPDGGVSVKKKAGRPDCSIGPAPQTERPSHPAEWGFRIFWAKVSPDHTFLSSRADSDGRCLIAQPLERYSSCERRVSAELSPSPPPLSSA